MEKLVKAFNVFIPFVAAYPSWVKLLVALWILLTAIIVILFIFVPKTNSPQGTSETLDKQQAASHPESELLKPKNLHDLFLSDFEKTRMLSEYRMKINNNTVYTIEYMIVGDFDTKSLFFSMYFPKSDYTFDACKYIIPKYKEILSGNIRSLMKGIVHHAPGENAESWNELSFSGRVYIYHETRLLPDRIQSLSEEYKKAELYPQFRGRDYLIMRNSPLYEK